MLASRLSMDWTPACNCNAACFPMGSSSAAFSANTSGSNPIAFSNMETPVLLVKLNKKLSPLIGVSHHHPMNGGVCVRSRCKDGYAGGSGLARQRDVAYSTADIPRGKARGRVQECHWKRCRGRLAAHNRFTGHVVSGTLI